MYAQMNIGTRDRDPLDISIEPEENDYLQDHQWSLVDTFLTDKSINFDAIKRTFSALWRPVFGVWMQELGPNLFLYQFSHELDLQAVIDSSPWTFDQQLLVFTHLKPGDNPRLVEPTHMDILFEYTTWR